MATFFHSCNFPFISFILFVSIFTFQSSHSSPLHHHRHLLQADSPQNIETVFPTAPFPASPPNSPPSNPPTSKPGISPTPNTAPAQTPPPSQNSPGHKAVAKAVVVTAASTLVFAGLFFFLLHRFGLSRRWRRHKGDKASFASNPYRNEETAVSGDGFKPVNGALKGLIVDENGLDVLYWRKLENGSLKNGTYKEVLNGPNKEKRHGHGGVRHSNSDPIPKIRSFSTNSSDSSVEISLSRFVFSPPRNRTSAVGVAPVAQLPPPSPTPIVVHENPAPPKPPPPPPSVVISEKPAPPPPPPPPSPTPTKKNPTLPPPPPMPAKKNPVPPPPPPQASSAKPPPPPPPPPPSPTPTKKNPTLPPPPPMPAKKNPVPPPPPPQASSAKPPPAPPFGSKGKLSSSSSRKVSGTSEGGKSRKEEAQAKLKPLHWDKVTANAEHSMVWDKIGSGSFRFDDELMEALFGYVASNRKSSDPTNNSGQQSSTSGSNSTVKAPMHLLDPRKSQNIAIVLRSVAVTRQEILEALLNGQALNADTLEKLTKIAPTQEEEAMILAFSGNPSKLGDAESFLYHLLQAVPSPFRRLDLMLFRTTYDAEILHLKDSLQALELACKELRTRGLFLKLLEAVLKAGNRLNAGTARGNAQAFNLTALRKLSDVKSTDGKTTLLHFVVEEVVRSEGKRLVINRNHSFSRSNSNSSPSNSMATEDREKDYIMLGLPVVGGLTVEFANVKKAAAIDYENFIKAGSALSARLSDIRRFLESQDANGKGGGYVKEMEGFAEAAEEELEVVKGEEGRVMELVARTADYYQAGASRGKGARPFQLFVIVKDFLSMVDQVCINISRNQQQKKKPAVGSSSLAPPQSSPPRVAVRFPILPPHFMSNSDTSSSDSEDGF